MRTFSETWVEGVLRQLVQMERHYESDEEILDTVATRAGLELDRVVAVLRAKVSTRCNVGFNSTSPERRMAKIMLAVETLAKIAPNMLQGIDAHEVAKEIFGAAGFRDGQRFFPNLAGQEDPRIVQMQQQIAQLTQIIETKQIETQGRIEVARVGGEYRLAATQLQVGLAAELGRMKFQLDAQRMQLEELDRRLAIEKADKERRQLYLEREALSHSIQEADRQFMLKLAELSQVAQAGAAAGAKPVGGGKKGAYNLSGNDRAGVISRGQYGAIPQHAG